MLLAGETYPGSKVQHDEYKRIVVKPSELFSSAD